MNGLTEIPRGASNLLGVMDLRGEITPVYDVKTRLKLSDRAPKLAGPAAECEPLPRSARVLVLATWRRRRGSGWTRCSRWCGFRPRRSSSPRRGWRQEQDGIAGIGRADGELYVLLDLSGAILVRPLAAVPEPDGDPLIQLCAFFVGDEEFVIDIMRVDEILQPQQAHAGAGRALLRGGGAEPARHDLPGDQPAPKAPGRGAHGAASRSSSSAGWDGGGWRWW